MRVEFELTNEMKKQAIRTLSLEEVLNASLELAVVENQQHLLPLLLEVIGKTKSKCPKVN